MSDLHALPLRGRSIEFAPYIRARVYKTAGHWWWTYTAGTFVLAHGPFDTHAQALASALAMLER